MITGDAPSRSFPAETLQVSGLGYNRDEAAPPGNEIAGDIAAGIKRVWPGGCDIIHVHNPTLGKNIRILNILEALRQMGFRLLLQIHDFAEDGRPDFYLPGPYPEACHYAVINSRDHHILTDAGLKEEGLHLLPNTVTPIGADSTAPAPPGEPYALYPVRAIRRKNIGEALLLSLFFAPGRRLAVTLPPGSPVDVAAYETWRRFAATHRFPVRFEAGVGNDFSKLAAGADFMITTSITEGFGFSFLEPWTVGKPIRGRKLPEICRDFETLGMQLGGLYHHLLVTTDWFDRTSYVAAWRDTVTRAGRQFGRPVPPEEISGMASRLSRSSHMDFGMLNEKYQGQVLKHLILNPEKKGTLIELNPKLADLSHPQGEIIEHNREIVLSKYNADIYRKNLLGIYRRVVDTPVRHHIRKDVLLSHFWNPTRMSLLKWGDYERWAIKDE